MSILIYYFAIWFQLIDHLDTQIARSMIKLEHIINLKQLENGI